MSLVNLLMRNFFFEVARFESQTKNPLKVQEEILLHIVRKNQDTLFGTKHKFSEINSINDFQRNVGVNSYETLSAYIKKMLNGQQNVLVSEKPIFFAVTSGTTSRPKFIPVTASSRRAKSRVMNVWLYYMMKDHPTVFSGKTLAVVSPAIEGYTKSGVPYGSESGDAYRNVPWIIRNHYALPYEVFCIENYEARYYAILRFGLEARLTNLATMNPSTILLLCQKVEKYAERIIEDIRHGTICPEFKIEEDLRVKLARALRPNPNRAKELEDLLRAKGTLLPKDIWPDLALVESWKGGSVGLYLSELISYFPQEVKVRDFGYLSTEARCSIPRWDNGCAGILTVGTNFYEFIPEEEIDIAHPRYLTVDKLLKDRRYFVVFTTQAGLYRYNIGDIVKVTGFYHKTPLIEFIQKGQNVSSVTGEKLYENQVTAAMNKAREKTHLNIEFFCCFLDWKIPPRYSFVMEFIDEPAASQKKIFLKELETNLCKINIEYRAKRRSQRLGDPRLLLLKKGSFEAYRKVKLAGLPHDGQFKFAHLKADFKIPPELKVKEEIPFE